MRFIRQYSYCANSWGHKLYDLQKCITTKLSGKIKEKQRTILEELPLCGIPMDKSTKWNREQWVRSQREIFRTHGEIRHAFCPYMPLEDVIYLVLDRIYKTPNNIICQLGKDPCTQFIWNNFVVIQVTHRWAYSKGIFHSVNKAII